VGFRLTLDDYCLPVGLEGARVGCVVTGEFCLGVVREQTGEGNLRGMKGGSCMWRSTGIDIMPNHYYYSIPSLGPPVNWILTKTRTCAFMLHDGSAKKVGSFVKWLNESAESSKKNPATERRMRRGGLRHNQRRKALVNLV